MRTLPAVLVVLLIAAAPVAAQADPVARAAALIEREEFAAARQILAPHAAAHPRDARAAWLLGRALLGADRAGEGAEQFERAVRLEPTRADYHFWLGNAYGVQAQRANIVRQASLARRAKGAFERAVALDPDHLEARYGLVQFHLLAPGVMGGDRRQALAQAQEIRARNPYRGAQALADYHLVRRDTAAAIAELERVIPQYPDSAAAVTSLGLLLDGARRHDRARELYAGYLRRNPDDPRILYQVGRLGAVSGERLDESTAALRRYLSRPAPRGSPSHAAAHWRLGMILERQGRPAEARAEYNAALRLDPKHREAQAALRRLGAG